MEVKEAQDGDAASPGRALVAPLLEPTAVGLLESVEPRPGGISGRFALQPDGTLQRLGE